MIIYLFIRKRSDIYNKNKADVDKLVKVSLSVCKDA